MPSRPKRRRRRNPLVYDFARDCTRISKAIPHRSERDSRATNCTLENELRTATVVALGVAERKLVVKSSVPTVVIGSGLQAAAAFYPSMSDHENEILYTSSVIDELESGNARSALAFFEMPLNETEVSAPMTFPLELEWNSVSRNRFRILAKREALETATDEDLAELESLSHLRRKNESTRTGEEVMREYEQGQLLRQLFRSLTRYVQFEERPLSHATNSARSRTKAKTQSK
jgi:hypothetical protein